MADHRLSATTLIPHRLLMAGHRWGRLIRRNYVGMTPQDIRIALDQLSRLNPGPFGAEVHNEVVAGVPTMRIIWPRGTRRNGLVVMAHGGGFAFGSPVSHRALGVHLARETGLEVWIPDYRLAPEHPFPAALEDFRSIAHHLSEIGRPITAIVGDSAGGNLAASWTRWLLEHLPQVGPAGCALLSPWMDLSPQSLSNLQDAEALSPFDRYDMLTYSEFYLHGHSAEDPEVSPLRGDFKGFPETYLEGSRVEYLWPDVEATASKLADLKVPSTLRIESEALHGWQLFPDVLPEAKRSVAGLAAFIEGLGSATFED